MALTNKDILIKYMSNRREPGHKWRRGKTTMDEIRGKYGSQTITGGSESYSRGNCPVAI